MPSPTSKASLSLADFADLFVVLSRVGTQHIVIGGCAVGAYGRLIGETVVSEENHVSSLGLKRALVERAVGTEAEADVRRILRKK